MSNGKGMIAITGSNRPAVPGAKLVGKADPKREIRISIYAKPNSDEAAKTGYWIDELNSKLPGKRTYMSSTECAKAYGPKPGDIDKIIEWAKACHLRVIKSDATSRLVQVEGSIGDIDAAFGVQLNEYDHPTKGHYRGREGQVFIPSDLSEVIEGVEGLDTR